MFDGLKMWPEVIEHKDTWVVADGCIINWLGNATQEVIGITLSNLL